MAEVVLVYGPKGAGKTAATLRLAHKLEALGVRVGGFFQRSTRDELDRRGYELVRFTDPNHPIILASPAKASETPNQPAVCSFVFSSDAIATGLAWLHEDANLAQVLVIDEVSKLEVSRQGHALSVEFALGLPPEKIVVLSVRGDQLFYVVERFELDDRVVGDLEIPSTESHFESVVHTILSRLSPQT